MKILIYSLFIILYGINSAIAVPPQKSPSGAVFSFPVRVGVGAAVEYMTAETDTKIKPGPNYYRNISSQQNQKGKKLQVSPCLEIGSTFYDVYYFGLHFSWRHSGVTSTSQSPFTGQYNFLHKFKVNTYFNAFFKPGYKLTPQVMIYGLIGPSIANWSDTIEQFFADPITRESTLKNQYRTKKTSIGLGLGLGLEYLFRKKYAFSFDYTYCAHRSKTESKTINYEEQTAVLRGPLRTRTRSETIIKTIRPSYSTFAVRFTYFFSIP